MVASDIREQKAVDLTNRIHGHIGIYSILGAKMGLRALELLEADGADIHDLRILSHAGNNPPVSCLNDGLQISTGATLGRGRIRVPDTDTPCAEAVFSCSGRSFRISLKTEYEQQIRSDIGLAVERFGHSPAYWHHVQELALQYQRTWCRDEIFSLSLES